MEKLLEGYARFRAERWPAQRELYARLAEGQKPRLLVIACSDSRVDPGQIFDVAPGELFVVRNVAALVPPCEQGEGLHGTSAAIEFAVETLEVRTILVLGHARCGGVQAAIDRGRWFSRGGGTSGRASFVNQWIDQLIPAIAGLEPGDHVAAERRAVSLSLANLMGFPFVAERVAAGTLSLEGARFDIATGALDLHAPDGTWLQADRIVDARIAAAPPSPAR